MYSHNENEPEAEDPMVILAQRHHEEELNKRLKQLLQEDQPSTLNRSLQEDDSDSLAMLDSDGSDLDVEDPVVMLACGQSELLGHLPKDNDLDLNDELCSSQYEPEAEDPLVILAQRNQEDEQNKRLKLLLQDNNESPVPLRDGEQHTLSDILKDAGSRVDYRHDLYGPPPGERVLGCCRTKIFTAHSITVDQFFSDKGQAATCCHHYWKNLTSRPWHEVIPCIRRVVTIAQNHDCAFIRDFLRYLFFLASVCEDHNIVHCCSKNLFVCHEGLLTVTDLYTVLLNWGIDHHFTAPHLTLSPEFQPKISPGTGAPMKSESLTSDSKDSTESEIGTNTPLYSVVPKIVELVPFVSSTGSNVKLMCAVLRMLVMLLADYEVCCSQLQHAITHILELIRAQKWSDNDLIELICALNLKEFNPLDRINCAKSLFWYHDSNTHQISAAVAFVILQQIHGIPPNKLQYVSELCASHLLSLLPSLSYSNLTATELQVSLEALQMCSAGIISQDRGERNIYRVLCQHLTHLQHEISRLPVLDNHFIKILIASISLVWKAKAGFQSAELQQFVTNNCPSVCFMENKVQYYF